MKRKLTTIHYTEWHGVAAWRWNVKDDCCGICRNAFDACCPDCKVPGDDCPPGTYSTLQQVTSQIKLTPLLLLLTHTAVWGMCNHAFHMHCIVKWLSSQTVRQHCPMCRKDWKFRA